MKWIDYREKLGLGFSDTEKTEMFRNNVLSFLRKLFKSVQSDSRLDPLDILDDYFYFIGESYRKYDEEALLFSVGKEVNISGILSKAVVYVNIVSAQIPREEAKKIQDVLPHILAKNNISFELKEDGKGIFIFPKGVPELDEALVSAPLEWLNDYPESRKAWIKALNDYADQTDENASDIADKFRKALERFMQEFFGSEKSLENLLPEYGEYLKGHGVPAEISNDFKKLLNGYTDYINNYAKHHDRTSRKVLEYIMYETGNVMRLLITLKQEETSDAD